MRASPRSSSPRSGSSSNNHNNDNGGRSDRGDENVKTISVRHFFLYLLVVCGTVYVVMVTKTLRAKASRDTLVGPFWGRDTLAFKHVKNLHSIVSTSVKDFLTSKDFLTRSNGNEDVKIPAAGSGVDKPGMISSVNFLELLKKTEHHTAGLYEIALATQPKAPVTIRVIDPKGCTITSPEKFTWTEDNWSVLKPFRSFLQNSKSIPASCGVGLIHVFSSEDPEYDRLHVRIRLIGLGVPQLGDRPSHLHIARATESPTTRAEDTLETIHSKMFAGDTHYLQVDASAFGGPPSSQDDDEDDEDDIQGETGIVGASDDEMYTDGLEESEASAQGNDAFEGEAIEEEPVLFQASIEVEPMLGRQNLDADIFKEMYDCELVHDPSTRYQCTLAKGRPYETKFYINVPAKRIQAASSIQDAHDADLHEAIFDGEELEEDVIDIAESDEGAQAHDIPSGDASALGEAISANSLVDDSGMIALIIGGVHGNEPSGSVAATHIQRNWIPKRGTFVVIDRANIIGLSHSTRYIRGARDGENDLNRNFPQDDLTAPKGPLAKEIWTLASILRPDVLFDLHEGWGFYAQLKDNPHEKLVGAKKFSKGSSIICTEKAAPLAQFMIDEINESIPRNDRKFWMITPPISGGLAMRLATTFGTLALVTETTSRSGSQSLTMRAKQQLALVARGVRELGFVEGTFQSLANADLKTCGTPGAEKLKWCKH